MPAGPRASTRKQRFLTVTTPYDHETIGPLLARLRQARGLSQLALAQTLCAVSGHATITRHEVSRWERQERIPSPYWLGWLAEALTVPIDVLRRAVAATRDAAHRRPAAPLPDTAGASAVLAWLTLHHGPHETMIALGGVQVDQLRTVLAPINPTPPADPDTTATTSTVEAAAR
jgi:transcriptional regulator with XRE-family HTH domain